MPHVDTRLVVGNIAIDKSIKICYTILYSKEN